MGWVGGGQHTTTVLSNNGDGIVTTYDDLNDCLKVRMVPLTLPSRNAIAETISIYRICDDDLYLDDGTDIDERQFGTKFSDLIKVRTGMTS